MKPLFDYLKDSIKWRNIFGYKDKTILKVDRKLNFRGKMNFDRSLFLHEEENNANRGLPRLKFRHLCPTKWSNMSHGAWTTSEQRESFIRNQFRTIRRERSYNRNEDRCVTVVQDVLIRTIVYSNQHVDSHYRAVVSSLRPRGPLSTPFIALWFQWFAQLNNLRSPASSRIDFSQIFTFFEDFIDVEHSWTTRDIVVLNLFL